MSFRQFLQRSKNAANHVIGRQPMARTATAFTDDVWLTSYPKSGNTWTRFLLANLIAPNASADWSNIENLVPDFYVNDDPSLRRVRRPRFIKSHEAYRPEYRRVLLIVRDPRDIAISYFHFAKKIGWLASSSDIGTFIPRFLDGQFDAFGSWGENVGSWLGARRGTRDFLVVRYEDLLGGTARELARIAACSGSLRERTGSARPWRTARPTVCGSWRWTRVTSTRY